MRSSRLRLRAAGLLLTAAVALALVPLGARAAVADEPRYGVVTGRVVAASDGSTGIAETRVIFIGQDNLQYGQGQADQNGVFTTAVPAGQYYVHFVPFNTFGSPYSDMWWENSADRQHAQLLTVVSGQRATIAASLPAAATVSGVAYVDHLQAFPAGTIGDGVIELTDCATGVGSPWIRAPASIEGSAYTITGVPPGTYAVSWRPADYTWGSDYLIPGYYSGTYDQAQAQLITVDRGQNVSGIDLHGAFGGSLGGTVWMNGSLQPASVSLYDLDGTLLDQQYSDNGYWDFNRLLTGRYKVSAMLTNGITGWAVYGRDSASASVLDVTIGQTTYTQVSLASTAFSAQPQSTNPQSRDASAQATAGHFADVTTANPFYDAIEWMAASGISTGTLDPPNKPLYKPLDAMSRQAFAAFLYRYSGITFSPPQTSTFADVGPENPFYAAIEWMAANGYTTGTPQPCGKPLFDPEGTISRQATAAFLARFAQVTPAAPTTQVFADVPNDAFFASYIDWMGEQGISTGTPQPGGGLPLFKPTDPVTRQEVAAFLNRFDNL